MILRSSRMNDLACLVVGLGLATLMVGGLGGAEASIPKDRIESLPGWKGALPTNQYSGYLSVEQGFKHLHYWFVESENDPSTDPLLAWFNGGPGCSSLGGFFTENGPFGVNITDNGPVLFQRETRWNKFANVLFIEAPAGVGFSYANSPAGYVTNDSVTAQDNYEAIQQFLEGFSEYRNHEFFIAGESYAGVYVPTLAYQILQRAGRNGDPPINLKGFMVGNGCTGKNTGSCNNPKGAKYRTEYLGRKGFFSDALRQTIQKECTDWFNASTSCQIALAKAQQSVGAVNIYNVYGKCILSNPGGDDYSSPLISQLEKSVMEQAQMSSDVSVKPQPGPVPCIDGGPTAAYLNQLSVRSAIHVASESTTGKWSICTNKIDYTITQPDEPKTIYPDLIKNYRVLVYNGDADSCVPYIDNEEWTSEMGIPIKKHWRPWYVNQQVAGYVTQYEQEFYFLTVKGAGHMVPEFKPEQGYMMAYRFVKNQPF